MRINIPRWAQMMLFPVAIFLGLYFSRSASHAVFIFIISTMVALLLNPLVLGLGRIIKCPRWLAVPVVYLSFVAVVVVTIIFLGPLLAKQFQYLFDAIPGWLTSLNGFLQDTQGWLARYGIDTNLTLNNEDIVNWLQANGTKSVATLFSVGVSVVGWIVNFFLVVVVSFYMLIDGRRITRYISRIVPGDEQVGEEYTRGLQSAFSKFVRGQALLGATIGLASGLAVWVLSWDVVGIWPDGGQYALLFGFWAGLVEVIPYVGPFLGAVPPVIAALFYSPTAALVFIVVYLVIQQLESHILAPNIVGSSVGVHPLIVIFTMLAGAQIAGILGMLFSMPIVAMIKFTLTYYDFNMSKSPWAGDDGIVLIPAKSGAPPPRRIVRESLPDEHDDPTLIREPTRKEKPPNGDHT